MSSYKLEEKKSLSCEVCGAKMAAMKATAISVNEFHKRWHYQNSLYLF